jgi:catechol 2,3-dioxygenase-like lactoylglutathione lyase family enzyme
MTIQRMDHVGVVVDDLAAATAFFGELGFTAQGEGSVEGGWVDCIVGLEGVQADFAMMETPDGHGRLDLGVVIGEEIDDFSRVHRAVLTGQQFQSPDVEPYYILFEDFTHVKFYRRSLYDGAILQGARFDGFSHVDDWVPQRLVTATGPTPLPR